MGNQIREYYKKIILDILKKEEIKNLNSTSGITTNELFRRYSKVITEREKTRTVSKKVFLEILGNLIRKGIVERVNYKNRKLVRLSKSNVKEGIDAFLNSASLLIASKKRKIEALQDPMKIWKELENLKKEISLLWARSLFLFTSGSKVTLLKPKKKARRRLVENDIEIPYEIYYLYTQALRITYDMVNTLFKDKIRKVNKFLLNYKLEEGKEVFSQMAKKFSSDKKDFEKIYKKLRWAFYQRSNAPGELKNLSTH